MQIDLTTEDLALLREAFDSHLSCQLKDEPHTEARASLVRALADRVLKAAPGLLAFTAEEAGETVEALDSHLYWTVSDPSERRDGYANWEDSDDADHREECSKVEEMEHRFECLREAAEVAHPDLRERIGNTACDECHGLGYGHFESTTHGREIERCDTCAPEWFTDAHAVALHDAEHPGCRFVTTGENDSEEEIARRVFGEAV